MSQNHNQDVFFQILFCGLETKSIQYQLWLNGTLYCVVQPGLWTLDKPWDLGWDLFKWSVWSSIKRCILYIYFFSLRRALQPPDIFGFVWPPCFTLALPSERKALRLFLRECLSSNKTTPTAFFQEIGTFSSSLLLGYYTACCKQ